MIADRMLTICESDWIGAYWLTKMFARQLDEHFNRRTTVVAIAEMKQQLATVDPDVWQKFANDDVWTQLPIELWLRTAGATIFTGKALEKYDNIYINLSIIQVMGQNMHR